MNLVVPIGPVILMWLPMPVCIALTGACCWQASRTAGVPAPAARFWRHIAVTMALLTACTAKEILDAFGNDFEPLAVPGPLTLVGYCLTVCMFVVALFRLPLGVRSRAQRVTLWFDVGTVMLAAAVFLWHFTTRGLLLQRAPLMGPAEFGATVALMVLELIGVFAVTKVALTGSQSLDRRSLRWLGIAPLVPCVASSLEQLLANTQLRMTTVAVPFVCLLLAMAAECQRAKALTAQPGTSAAFTPRRRRAYSRLPYLAVAATDVLLLVVTSGSSRTERLIVAVVVVGITGLVVARQLTAFAENEQLLTQRDAGLVELGRREQRFRSLVQNSSDVIVITDARGVISYLSPAVERVLGVPAGAMLGQPAEAAIHPDDRAAVRKQLAVVTSDAGATAVFEVRLKHADGSWRWAEVTSANLLDDPSVGGIVSNARDITDEREFQERLRIEATHDPLTHLANRSLFGDRLRRSLAQAGADDRLSVVLVDLDGFKAVNDTLGHAAGDALLVAVAERMRRNVRPDDLVARLGGDEFAILMESHDAHEASRVVERIISALRAPVLADGHELLIRASFGIVTGRAGDDAQTLLRHADLAMYESKAQGDGTYRHYTAGMGAGGVQHAQIRAELCQAIEDGEFRVVYQPVVTLPDGWLAGVEALVRWQHPVRGLLSPAEFIPAAERTGLIVPLGTWVLREACRQAAAWRTAYGELAPGTVSVNVSPRQLRDPGFAAEVAGVLRRTGLEARRLVVEITESTAVGGGSTAETLRDLHDLGVRLALDDFGTGHSTLTLLQTCPVDQLKLDRSFTQVSGPGRHGTVATAVIQLAQTFGLEAVAEGVESRAEAERLRALGYEYAQGFHFARPSSAEDMIRVIEGSDLIGRPIAI